jgi:hypothetical protein
MVLFKLFYPVLPCIAVLSNPEKVFTQDAAQLFIKILGIKTPKKLFFLSPLLLDY